MGTRVRKSEFADELEAMLQAKLTAPCETIEEAIAEEERRKVHVRKYGITANDPDAKHIPYKLQKQLEYEKLLSSAARRELTKEESIELFQHEQQLREEAFQAAIDRFYK